MSSMEINPVSRKSAIVDSSHLKELQEQSAEEVADWLTTSGYGDYSENFIAHRITGECIPLLTHSDLEKVGIDKVGDRVKLMKDLREFRVALEIEHRTMILLKWQEFKWYCSPFDTVRPSFVQLQSHRALAGQPPSLSTSSALSPAALAH
jgi:hypothetical protein